MMEKADVVDVRTGLASRIGSAAPASKYRSIVTTYMRNRLPPIHPSFQKVSEAAIAEHRPALPPSRQTEQAPNVAALDAAQDNDEGGDVSVDGLYEEAEHESDRFRCLVRNYEETAGLKYRTSIDLSDVHTWDQVLAEVNRVASRYKVTQNFWSKVRRGLKKFGENHDAFDAWLGLLPTQSNYCSIICGGLKLVISAASRFKEVRESVFNALSEIPVLLNNTKLILRVFKKSQELHNCSSELYISTLAALAHMVTWFQERALKKFSKSLFKQDVYERSLTEKIAAIEQASKRFANAARTCSYQKQDEVHVDIRQTKGEIQLNRLEIERFRSDSARNFGQLRTKVDAEHKETRKDIESNLVKLETQMVIHIEAALNRFLSSNERINPKTGDLRKRSLPDRNRPMRIARIEKQRQRMEAALDMLEYNPSIPSSDIIILLRIAWTLTKPGQDRAVALMQSPKLHAWIKKYDPSILFVNGNFDSSARRSPLSFVCAKLIDSIQPSSSGLESEASTPRIIAHAFFCAEHLTPKDDYTGVAGLMRSLIAQILVSPGGNFTSATLDNISRTDLSNVDALCNIYHKLIMQISTGTTVFCIIDALSFHEDKKVRRNEALAVVQALADLTNSCVGDGHCVFKALLTCPGTSRALYKELAKGDVVWMPKKVSAQGGFTSMKWSASVGKDVAEVGRQESW